MISTAPSSLLKLIAGAQLHAADIFGNPDIMVTGIGTRAQSIERNHLFVAISGTKTDSHMLISEAVERGAAAVVVERDIPTYPGVTMVRVPNTRMALGALAQRFYGNPARAMTVVGVTGTNGKTTTSSLISAILARAGSRTGLIGTLGTFWDGKYVDENVTTPDAITLARQFAQMEQDRINAVIMEVSSHGIDQARIAGLPFQCGVLTNVTQDHLDYHGDISTYIATKRRYFLDYVATTPGSTSVLNVSDPVGEELVHSYTGDVRSYSAQGSESADVRAEDVRMRAEGTSFTLVAREGRFNVQSQLVGNFNLANMLAASAACLSLGIDGGLVADALAEVSPISGRFETIRAGQPFTVVVDYAHTPDALEQVLRTARRVTSGEMIVVFGCGGDRDRSKRPLMGKAVGRLADQAIVTSDNPRYEDPERIARAALEGLLQSGMKPGKYQVILDRRQAIEMALNLAKPGDTVLIAGKGHESYQEICGRRFPFDDRVTARGILGRRPAESMPSAVSVAREATIA